MALVEEIKVPLLAVNDTTLSVVELSLVSGTKVSKGDQLMVFETSKTTYDVEAQSAGFIQYCCVAGQDYAVGEVVAKIFSEAAEALAAPALKPPSGYGSAGAPSVPASLQAHAAASFTDTIGSPVYTAEPLVHWEGETIFSQGAMALIGTHGLDRHVFHGRDLVSTADVLGYLSPASRPPAAVVTPAGRAIQPHPPVDAQKATAQKLTSAKRREIEYLGEVQHTGLTSTIHTYVETQGIFTHINRSLRYLKDSLLPVIVYEASRLLTGYPQLNAWFAGDAIAQYNSIDPGFAIDIDKGLKVAKIAGAGRKSLQEIEADILALSGDYLDDKLKLEDITDITFTITDLSAEAVAFFQPLVNKMNSAILGISAIDGKLQRCTLSLTFDHRVTEGLTAARFLKELKERLESYRPSGGIVGENIACFKCYKTLAEDLAGTGFVHCVTPEGKEGYICQSCLKGF